MTVLQRVRRAAVTVEDRLVGSIEGGLLALVGVKGGDLERDVEFMARKIPDLRLFNDAAGKMNLSLREAGGSLLLVSQFTLLSDCRRGRRPSFTRAAPPEEATRLFDLLVETLRQSDLTVETGQFGANMQVELLNDGPVTILLDSRLEETMSRRGNLKEQGAEE